MASKKDIGKIFSEELNDFKASPTRVSWKNIEAGLKPKERYRMPYWILSIGLISIAVGTAIILNLSSNPNTNDKVTDTEITIENCEESIITEVLEIENIVEQNLPESLSESNKVKNTTNKTNVIIANRSKKANSGLKNEKNIPINTNPNFKVSEKFKDSIKTIAEYHTSNNTKVTETKHQYQKNVNPSEKTKNAGNSDPKHIDTKQKESTISKISNPDEYIKDDEIVTNDEIAIKIDTINNLEHRIKPEMLIAKKDTLLDNKTSKPIDSILENKFSPRFSVQAHIIPVYNIVPQGSLIDNTLLQNSNSGDISVGYGVILKSHLNKKFYSRIGYNQFRIRNEVKNIKTDSLFVSVLGSIGIRPNNQINQILSNQEEINFTQKINYHEIAMEVGYDIIDKKVVTSVIGGVSLVILNSNTITATSQSNTLGTGRNSKISKTNFSINLGASFQYKLSRNIYFNIEPIAKYQLQNATNNTASYKPFYFAIQTGFSYQF